MTKRIFQSILLSSLVMLLISLAISVGCLYYHFEKIQEEQLDSELALAASAVEESGVGFLERVENDALRLTLVDADGTVLYDTAADAESMTNHADREEIQEAFSTGKGYSSRYSSTLTEKTIYRAALLGDGRALRASYGRTTIFSLLVGTAPWIFLAAALAAGLSWLLAKRLSERIITPLNQVDLDNPLENDAYEELSPLLTKIHRQHEQIDAQLLQLRRKTDEFEHITASMEEGLVLLDAKGKILSINPAAVALFDVKGKPAGVDFLAIKRSHQMNHATACALKSGHASIREERKGRFYQFDVSRIESAGKIMGLVILAFDVSEKESAERIRREFSANVSHELKIPLTSIIASADLIENNLVKPEDMARFIGHIKREASHLLTLIEDIIRLSQLDEGIEMLAEAVDLGAVANEAVEQLLDVADKNNIMIDLHTEHCVLQGVPRLLYEIVYNLVENAIKYNLPNGKVDVSVERVKDGVELKVCDTGVGIPIKHQKRVFERFYRVDESHSKQSGGTGLGLSIVKHAASYFDADIALQSGEGKGTTITVTFPA
ncbi:MAG: ATP-binding protein [Thermoguttaceae bacterium]|nr:ATP-binding protein [Thermoguttaceae bacterium]